jgi:hypothetical protein
MDLNTGHTGEGPREYTLATAVPHQLASPTPPPADPNEPIVIPRGMWLGVLEVLRQLDARVNELERRAE